MVRRIHARRTIRRTADLKLTCGSVFFPREVNERLRKERSRVIDEGIDATISVDGFLHGSLCGFRIDDIPGNGVNARRR
ncbi:hypothetical protein FHT92_005862 [Rhizobium sp. BK377]|nr:hypothetical protein [Rhizobium sp. BK377]